MLKCPICQSPNTKLKYTINKYKYYDCDNCHTLFLYPQPTVKQLAKYYKQEFSYEAGTQNEKRIRDQAKHILKNLRKMNPAGKTLLDIGSGLGFFLDEAQKTGLDATGIEPSKKFTTLSQKLYHNKVFNTNIESYINKHMNIKYDFVTLINVIEHFTDPTKSIANASKLLNKKGLFYIETPNHHSWLHKFEKEKYTFLTPPDHVYIFSLISFSFLIKDDSSLKIRSVLTYSYPEHFMGIIKNFIRNQKNSSILCYPTLPHKKTSNILLKKIKIVLFDGVLAKVFYRLLNCFGNGSFLELYIKKF